jgi:hypothetical protein
MNKISFEYIPEHDRFFESGDGESFSHSIPDQIKILIDGKVIFDEGYGMFPSDFFSQNKHFYNGELQVGICGCSCYMCGDEFVNVESIDDIVIWTDANGNKFSFDKNEYMVEINNGIKNYRDEELYLKIEKIIFDELKNIKTENGFAYNTFYIYEYGFYIVIYFENNKLEEKFYIEYKNNLDNIVNEINELKKKKKIWHNFA